MINVKVERRNSGKTPWCQICGKEESRTIYFTPNERPLQSSVIHVCDDCAKDLINKLNDSLANEKI